MMGYRCDLAEQLHMLRMLLKQSPVIEQVLQESQLLGLTDYYIGAGCICRQYGTCKQDVIQSMAFPILILPILMIRTCHMRPRIA